MAEVLAILGSGRRRGYTANLLAAAMEGMKRVEGVEVKYVALHDYKFGPCNSCFNCIRNEDHMCTLDDDMGRKGKAELFSWAAEANGMFLADPVHMWGPSACCHLFIERLYPMLWTGRLVGMPFASISCATNQGMQRLANREICKWAFTHGMKYIGGLPVHAAYFQRALEEAEYLGRQLALAALEDEREGRKRYTDLERYLAYMDKPWSVFQPYMENLSNGTMRWEDSLMEIGLRLGTFVKPEAIELLRKSQEEFKKAMNAYRLNDYRQANEHLVAAGAYWAHATYEEFLAEQVIKATIPPVYRPLPEGEAE